MIWFLFILTSAFPFTITYTSTSQNDTMPTVADTPNDFNGQPQMPSELYNAHNPGAAEPHMVDTPPQQGATMPGSGSEVHEEGKVPFKDQMIGYAKSIRGSVLKQPETKETGEKILNGEISAKEYFEQKKE